MKSYNILIIVIACLILRISANHKLDAWMHENKIDPDFMHYKAMNIRQKVHRMDKRHKKGIYTKNQLLEHRAMLAN